MLRRVVVLSLLASAGLAHADIVGDPLVITARALDGSGRASSFAVPTGAGSWNGARWSWSAPMGWRHTFTAPDGSALGSLESPSDGGVGMNFLTDPILSLNFTVVAGPVPTEFTFSSGELVFAAYTNPLGSASAGLTLTDRNGNGATVEGLHDGGFGYRANVNGLVPGGSTFAHLLAGFGTGPFQTQVGSGALSQIIPGTVASMSTEFRIRVSAFDSVAGTSVFQVIPTPGSLALLGLTGLVLGRRRR